MGLLRLVFGNWVTGIAWLVALAIVVRILVRVLSAVLRAVTGPLVGGVSRPHERRLLIMVVASVVWLAAILGAAFPLSLASLPAFQSLSSVPVEPLRTAFLVALILIPLAVGLVSQALPWEDRPARPPLRRAAGILWGYRYTAGLAIALLASIAGTAASRVRAMIRRWGRRTVTVRIAAAPETATAILDDVQRALEAGEVHTTRAAPPWWLRLPGVLLRSIGGGVFDTFISGPLAVLVASEVEILVFPSALTVSGRPQEAARAQASLAEHLPFSGVSMTWTPQGRRIEDRLRTMWADLAKGSAGPVSTQALDDVREIGGHVRAAPLSYEEWDVLFREWLLVQHRLLERAVPARVPDARVSTS
jgi:hypothetical protein